MYKVLLTLAGVVTAAGFLGSSLGQYAQGDAFFFYKQQPPVSPTAERSQALRGGWAYAVATPAAQPEPQPVPSYAAVEFSPERSLDDMGYDQEYVSYADQSALYADSDDAYALTAAVDHASSQKEAMTDARQSRAVSVERGVADDEWESVGDTARLPSPPELERSQPVSTGPSLSNEGTSPPVPSASSSHK